MKRAVFTLLLLNFLTGWTSTSRATTSGSTDSSQPVSLSQCIQIALDDNPQLRQASTRFLEAKGEAIRLHAILYPTLNTQVLSTPLVIYTQLQQILSSHATAPQLQISRLTEGQAMLNYQQVVNDVVFQIRQAYALEVYFCKETDLLRNYTEGKDSAVQTTQQLFEGGQIQKSVVQIIRVQANFGRQFLAKDELARTQARLALETLLGRPFPASARFTGEFTTKTPENLATGELIAEALRDREDLKLLESRQVTAEQQVEVDVKNAYPIAGLSSISAIQPPSFGFNKTFNAEANYNEPTTERQAGDTQLPFSLYATWQIFDGGNLKGVKTSETATIASRDEALAELKQSISSEVEGAVARILTQRDKLKILDTRPSPEELRHVSELDYQAGKLRQLDKINLENDILQIEQSRLDSEFQLFLASAALDHALGHGLKITHSPPSSQNP